MNSIFFDAKSLAEYLRISIRTLETQIKLGELPSYIRIGRQRRWFKSDIDDYLKRKRNSNRLPDRSTSGGN